jgi:hypothetical protein
MPPSSATAGTLDTTALATEESILDLALRQADLL